MKGVLFSQKRAADQVGEKVFRRKRQYLYRPSSATAPGSAFDAQGLPTVSQGLRKRGVVKSLNYDRYWAKKKGVEPTAISIKSDNQGGSTSIEEMIKSTERGILVTRFWYTPAGGCSDRVIHRADADGTFLMRKAA